MAKEKLRGNQNARKGEHSSLVMRLDVPTVDLIYRILELEGQENPTDEDVVESVKMELHLAFERRKGKALRIEQRFTKFDPYVAGNIAARGVGWWDETTAEQEADKANLTGERRDEFLRGWQDEIASREQERQGQMVKEYDEMSAGSPFSAPADR